MERTRILLGVTLGEMGGAQKVVASLAEGLPEAEYEIDVVCGQGEELPGWLLTLNQTRKHQINLIQLSLGREIELCSDLRAFIALVKLMRRRNYKLAHFHSTKMGILGRIAAKLTRVPKIYFTVHGWAFGDYQSKRQNTLAILLERFCARFTDKIICVTAEDQKRGLAKRIAREDSYEVIHNGINPPTFQPGRLRGKLGIGEETLLIGTIARATAQKAPEFFLEIAHAFGEQYKAPHKFVFIGDGPLFEDCKRIVAGLNLDTVHLLGAFDHAASLLCDIDLFVLWSRWESLPVAIIEAMFAGKSVLATDVGGNYELVTDGLTGYLAGGFKKEEILTQLLALANNPQLRESMGNAGRKKAEANFKLQEMITKHSSLYQSPAAGLKQSCQRQCPGENTDEASLSSQ